MLRAFATTPGQRLTPAYNTQDRHMSASEVRSED
jgi:hypothetical protein